MRAEDVLADDTNEATFDGVTVRKGTVGAFLANVRVWSDSTASKDDQLLAEREIIQSLPALKAIGLLDVFEPKDFRLRELIAKAGVPQ
ncbi:MULTISPECIES: DUF7709 family protein [Pseudomonas]|uniref:DUF7709 domain-containing protein n=1 Tax=Pseudomonas haemolytica TaxID=2600065 RepID=A0A5P1D903_9PSED|nr:MULTISPECIES: hypothetical protein [Pseudomonas]MBJ2245148.1 hypothetical protein [Pseudomonas haemolytica]MBJ2272484.1 hypothetical protein [Pseudomonas haemolytica]MBJ2287560.1 hypothetical protein [Pseudomonas sp. MF6755]MBK3446821.1 hypothetical protein [Pseudomonas haemolytica]MBK3458316.1 hypothetical protein [Pseudomonas haemolytica]